MVHALAILTTELPPYRQPQKVSPKEIGGIIANRKRHNGLYGHGKRMILEVVSHFSGRMLFSRLAPESEAMYHLLTNNVFNHATTGDEGYRYLMYTR